MTVIKTRTTTLGGRKLELLYLLLAHCQAMASKYARFNENICTCKDPDTKSQWMNGQGDYMAAIWRGLNSLTTSDENS